MDFRWRVQLGYTDADTYSNTDADTQLRHLCQLRMWLWLRLWLQPSVGKVGRGTQGSPFGQGRMEGHRHTWRNELTTPSWRLTARQRA